LEQYTSIVYNINCAKIIIKSIKLTKKLMSITTYLKRVLIWYVCQISCELRSKWSEYIMNIYLIENLVL